MFTRTSTVLIVLVVLLIFVYPIAAAGGEKAFAIVEWEKAFDLAETKNKWLETEKDKVASLLDGKKICGTDIEVPSVNIRNELTVILNEANKLIKQGRQLTESASIRNKADLMNLSDIISEKLIIANLGHMMVVAYLEEFKKLPLCERIMDGKGVRI